MTDLRPGAVALLDPAFVDRVPAPAYDSVGPRERRAILHANPDSYLAITRSEEDDPTATAQQVLEGNRDALDRLHQKKAFGPPERRLLLYRLQFGDHQQTGIVTELAVDAIRHRRLKPHEQVFPQRSAILAAHLAVVGAQSSPIAVAYAPVAAVADLVAEVTAEHHPVLDFIGPDGLRQTVWDFPHAEALDLVDHQSLYLLDGHHRAAAAVGHADRCHATPDDPASWLLAVLFPADSLQIFGFDRRVLDPRFSTDQSLARIAEAVGLEPADEAFRPTRGTEFGVYAAGRWHRATVPPLAAGPLAELAPVLLQSRILEPVFAITDPQRDHRLDYIPAVRDPAELAAETDEEGGLLFTLAPITADQLMAVADGAEVLPPKSTFLTPEVRSGIFLRLL